MGGLRHPAPSSKKTELLFCGGRVDGRRPSTRPPQSGEVEGEQGFAKAGVAVKGGQFTARDALFPESMESLRFDVGKQGTVSI